LNAVGGLSIISRLPKRFFRRTSSIFRFISAAIRPTAPTFGLTAAAAPP